MVREYRFPTGNLLTTWKNDRREENAMGHANVSVFVPHIGCPNQCSFCNQRSISGQQHAPTPDEVAQVCQQAMQLRKGNLQDTQLAFFGGSFTAIERGYMLSLLRAAQPFIGGDGFAGIRISTRPDAVGEEILEILRQYHVTSIELGVQSMSDRVLGLNKRGHTAQDVVNAAGRIKQYGFELGLQMMTGLYGSSIDDDRFTARQIAALQPAVVRIYPTITIQGTELAQRYHAGEYQPQTLEESVSLCAELLGFFEQRNIRVIRLGLHASQTLEQDMIAGPYHPAFRELCEGELYLQKALEQIKLYPEKVPLDIYVNTKAASKMAGQHRCNLEILQKRNPVKIRTSADIQPLCVKVLQSTSNR